MSYSGNAGVDGGTWSIDIHLKKGKDSCYPLGQVGPTCSAHMRGVYHRLEKSIGFNIKYVLSGKSTKSNKTTLLDKKCKFAQIIFMIMRFSYLHACIMALFLLGIHFHV